MSFNRDIRAILSDKCFFCHGPDNARREAELRLDQREAAVKAGAIIPGSADESEIIKRVLSDDPDVQMPPPDAKLGRLATAEIETLRQWIQQGAEYEDHWSFIPLSKSALGGFSSDRASERIDQVVADRLQERGLQMQPIADRNTLIRRLSFDITGLPPSAEEVTAFAADETEDAVERLVDRLLASPAYGERMTVDWLDISRYADSFGFQVDREREMWPWRDWVIRSFNNNMPFDQFITWQLAGDLLPDATDEQILATAFNRLHQQEAEGGSVEEEYRVEYVADRVQTFATAFLGLTFECCRCHDHKYDPIQQSEYYQLFAMFQNVDEAGLYSYFTQSPPTPALTLKDENVTQQLDQLVSLVREQETLPEDLAKAVETQTAAWLADPQRLTSEFRFPELCRYRFDEATGPSLANSASASNSPDAASNSQVEDNSGELKPAVLKGQNQLVSGREGNAVLFTGDDAVDLPLGNFRREEPFSVSLWLKTPDIKDRAVIFHRSRAWTDAASRGYELLIEDGRLKWSLIHFWPGNAASVRTVDLVSMNEWVHVTVVSDGSSRASGLQIFVNGIEQPTDVIRDHLTRQITGGGGDNIALGERFRDRGFKGGMIDDFRVFGRKLSSLEALAIFDQQAALAILRAPAENQSKHEKMLLTDHYVTTIDSVMAERQQSLQQARRQHAALNDSLRQIMVMQELPEPKKAYVLFRGEYNQRRDEVFAGTPTALTPFPKDAPKNRLGLAKWLVDPQHPLTARVTVNRVWQNIFGRGLVKTAEDFGSQGERPMYPEVLDTLSLSFIESGWDMKQLVKSIVLSRTYLQQSTADAATMKDDPDNQWLARGPRLRLSAEMIRDNALAAAGLLKPKIGGPPVRPYEMTEAFKPAAASSGDDVYRRSVYTNWRRTGPPPAMIAFDAPRRAVCTAKREQTDSPLQALVLLNGVQYVEAARVLGESLHVTTEGNVVAMIQQGCSRCISRLPDESEQQILQQLYAEQLQYYQSHPGEAAALLKIGQSPHNTAVEEAYAAAATILAQAILNHDECVVKR